jgi:pimeloyl-ACP methyl ester carboxylesterase
VPRVTRPDGTEIAWEERGAGPTVVITPHAWALPDLFDNLIGELEGFCRVVTYDARGTGGSSRSGPHDMDTGAADLAAVIEDAGGPAVVCAMADASGRAARTGAERPDLVAAVVGIGSIPIGIEVLRGTDALVASSTVVDAFIDMLATDFRGAMRPFIAAINTQWSEDQVRDRINRQVEYTPQDVVVERVRAWKDDDPGEAGRALGDRLWILMSPDTAGPWFPSPESLDADLERLLPEARRREIGDGIISAPELTATVIREVLAEAGSGGNPAG